MIRWMLLAMGLMMGFARVWAQRIAYVDIAHIQTKMPDYKSAMVQLETFVKQWKAQLRSKQQELEHLYQTYQAEKPLLTPAMRAQREEEIARKEQELLQIKEQFFGEGGMLEQKQAELLKPIQDRIYRAIQQLAVDEALDMVFDKSATPGLIFTNAKYDRTLEVMDILGIVATESEAKESRETVPSQKNRLLRPSITNPFGKE